MAETDRAYVSQYSSYDIGLNILVGSNPTDADGPVTVSVLNEDTGAVLFTRTADHPSVGAYQTTLTPDDNAATGNFTATWAYTLSGNEVTYKAFYAVGGAEPAYDALSPDLKEIVDSIWVRLADLYDSPSGGPNLQTWAATNFNRGRIAQLLKIAMGKLNTLAQPHQTYTIDGVGGTVFPTQAWGPLLEQMAWIETVRHLRRSYLEQPDLEGGNGVTRLNRQLYYDRWGAILAEEEANVRTQLDVFKISFMGLAKPSILVSGGVFGRYSSMNRPYMAARPSMWWANRF